MYVGPSRDQSGIEVLGYIPFDILKEYQITHPGVFDIMNCWERLAYLALVVREYEKDGKIISQNSENGNKIRGLEEFIKKPNITKPTKKHVKKLGKTMNEIMNEIGDRKIDTISNLRKKIMMVEK